MDLKERIKLHFFFIKPIMIILYYFLKHFCILCNKIKYTKLFLTLIVIFKLNIFDLYHWYCYCKLLLIKTQHSKVLFSLNKFDYIHDFSRFFYFIWIKKFNLSHITIISNHCLKLNIFLLNKLYFSKIYNKI